MKIMMLMLAGAIMSAPALQPARGQTSPAPVPGARVYVVSYVDAVSPMKPQAMALLKQFRASCAKEAGNLRCEAVQRMEQQNEFAVIEIWKDQPAFEAHAAGPGAQFRARLKPLLASPYDERVHAALSAIAPQTPPSGRVVYAITHVDVVQPRVGEITALLSQMADSTRKQSGNTRLEVLQQLAPNTDQFTLIAIWNNKRLLEANQAQLHMVQFREQLQSAIGAPYDERLYKILD